MRKIDESLIYIGTDDTDLDLFESQYIVPDGMSYNSYVILAGKVAVMDTVDARCAEEWEKNLDEALSGRQPDYLVVQHLEPDHSALIARTLERFPQLKLVATAKAVSMLPQFFPGMDFSGRTISVGEGDKLDLDGASLTFVLAPMVHWPEVMVSYMPEKGVLFSADAFGKFGTMAANGFYGDEDPDWTSEARRYYFNICGKYGGPVQNLLKKAAALDINMICPLHGPILRSSLGDYTGLYDIWSKYEVETEGVFVAYASIHGGTKEAALRFADILKAKGAAKVAVSDLCRDDQAKCVEDAFRYGTLVIAAASYDGGLFPPAAQFIHHLRDKAWQKRRVAFIENGSWAPCAARVMKGMFESMKDVEILSPTVTIRSRMHADDEAALEALADAVLS